MHLEKYSTLCEECRFSDNELIIFFVSYIGLLIYSIL